MNKPFLSYDIKVHCPDCEKEIVLLSVKGSSVFADIQERMKSILPKVSCQNCGHFFKFDLPSKEKPIIGQEAICSDGLGRVSGVGEIFCGKYRYIRVETYVNNRSCEWDPCNVELINPRK